MDEVYLSQLIKKCARVKNKFGGIYSADKFPVLLPNETFVVVDSENPKASGDIGHCGVMVKVYTILQIRLVWGCFLTTQTFPKGFLQCKLNKF